MVRIVRAVSPEEIDAVRALFEQYATGLGVDLSFQSFETELAGLPGDYSAPLGALLLAVEEGAPVGCLGIRPHEPLVIVELKRLFVCPEARGNGLGLRLTLAAIDQAREAGYTVMRLDTLPSMLAAQQMYERLGFRDIDPYRHNPIEGARYLELELGRDARA